MSEVNASINHIENYINTKKLKKMKIDYIISKCNEDETKTLKAYIHNKDDLEKIYYVKYNLYRDREAEILEVFEWDFNVDDHLLHDLENNWNLDYMSLDCHYDAWCAIDEWRDEISHINGLQKYLSYCQKNDITSSVISKVVNNSVDIMDLYQERHCNYEIIASVSIGVNTIVLGYNQNKKDYVTWRTTPNRKGGYDLGHYYTNYRDAFNDYSYRSNAMLENYLFSQKCKTRPKVKDGEER